MKKLLVVSIAVLMIMSLIPTAFADDNISLPPTDTPQITDMPQPSDIPQPTVTPEPTPEPISTPEPTETFGPTVTPGPTDSSKVMGTIQAMDNVSFASGDGTANNPYGVSTPDQLNAVRNYPNACFMMLNDIDVSATLYVNWSPISSFSGTFDGQGHNITGFNMSGNVNKAFINTIASGGKVLNLGISGTISANNYNAASFAYLNYGTIENCCNNAAITATKYGGASGIAYINKSGGIISKCWNNAVITGDEETGGITANNNGIIKDCYNSGAVKLGVGWSSVDGGITGDLNVDGSGCAFIYNCYNAGQVTGSGEVGAIAGESWNSEITNCYYLNNVSDAVKNLYYSALVNTVKLTDSQMKQQSSFAGFDFSYTWTMSESGSYLYPVLKGGNGDPGFGVNPDFKNGTGTADDPYQVSTVDELNSVRNHLKSHFILENDIDLSAATSEGGKIYNGGLGFEPIGNFVYPFTGVFDGNGHNITGMNINQPARNSTGLFGYLKNATVKKLGVKNVNITGGLDAGGISGRADSSLIEHCTSSGLVKGNISKGAFGGITGISTSGQVTGCSSETSVSSMTDTADVGGITGSNGNSTSSNTVSGCMNSGAVYGSISTDFCGGVSGMNYSTINDCYNIGIITKNGNNSTCNGIAGENYNGSINRCYNLCSLSNAIAYNYSSGSLKDCYYLLPSVTYTGTINNVVAKSISDMQQQATYADFDFGINKVWSMGSGAYTYPIINGISNITDAFSSVGLFAAGDGTLGNPYQIKTPEQLNNVRKYPDAYFILENDIDLTNSTSKGGEYYYSGNGWLPIDAFTGEFNGNGHKITGLNINRDITGLFNQININSSSGHKGKVYNISIINAKISISNYGGILSAYNAGIIDGVYVSGTINGGDSGGIVNGSAGTIKNSASDANINGNGSNGGIASGNSGDISCCYFSGGVIGEGGSGGIVSSNNGTIENCYNTGYAIDYNGEGGIACYNWGTIKTCYNIGTLDKYSGAIAKTNYSTIEDCYYLDSMGTGVYINEGLSSNCISKTDSEMQRQSVFDKFDFDTVWTMGGDAAYPYPELQSNNNRTPAENETDFAGGNGLPSDPYKITNPEQLNNIRIYIGSCFILMNDIDMEASTSNGGEYYNDGAGFIPIGDGTPNTFLGELDGNGYKIKGLNINSTSLQTGLFYSLGSSAVVKNLGIVDSDISGNFYGGYNGSICGSNNGSILRCYNSSVISGGSYGGGLTAMNNAGGVIKDCFNTGTVNSGEVGGISAENYGTITDCYNIGFEGTSGGANSLGAIAANNTGTISDCYYLDIEETGVANNLGTANTYKESEADFRVKTTFSGFDFDSVWTLGGKYNYPYPELQSCNFIQINENTVDFGGGSGYSFDPYLINTVEQLNNVRKFNGAFFSLQNDIDLSSATGDTGKYYNNGDGWDPIENFMGQFEGNGHTISGLNINRITEEYVGLFASTPRCSSVICDLKLTDINVKGKHYVGGLIGRSFAIIERCSVSGNVSDTGNYYNSAETAGLAGANNGTIIQCCNDCDVSGITAGGIAGYGDGTIVQCFNTGTVTGMLWAGGIEGDGSDTISDCYNLGPIIRTYGITLSGFGGICGEHESGDISNCYNAGNIQGNTSGAVMGGIVGNYISGDSISNCYYLNTINKAFGTNRSISSITSATDDELKQKSTFVGFDFDNIWSIEEGQYPKLKWSSIVYPESISLLPHYHSLKLGDTYQLTANIAPDNSLYKTVKWSSDKYYIASVDQNGNVTALFPGTAIITAETAIGGLTDSCSITVVKPVTGVTMSQSKQTLKIGETCKLDATIQPIDASDKKVSWKSDDESIVSVDQSGKVTAMSVGTTSIHVLSEDGSFSDECIMSIVDPHNVTFNSSGGSTVTGETVNYGDHIQKPIADPIKTGYIFGGWYNAYVKWDFDSDTMPDRDLTLYANWAPITFTIKYDANGGDPGITMDDSTFTYDVSTYLQSDKYTKNGYWFSGWATSPKGSALYQGSQLIENLTAEDGATVTLYAVWESESYMISYDLGGGAADNPLTYTIESNSIKLINPIKTGYVFGGWSGTDIAGISTEVIIPSGSMGARSYIANWTPITYSVKYDKNDEYAAGSMSDSAFTYNEPGILKTNGFTMTGYTFSGWALSSGGTALYTDGSSVKNLADTEGAEFTLYAMWTPITYIVRYDKNNGTGTTMDDSTFTYDKAAPLRSNTYTRSGYSFSGWAETSAGDTVYMDGQNVENLANTSDSLVTFYAKWSDIFTVAFNAGSGGKVTSASKNVVNGEVYGELPVPTKSGYYFSGWYTGTNGSGTLIKSTSIVNITSNTTLYTKWTKNSLVALKTPSLTVKSIDYKTITLSWAAVANAEWYEIYRSVGNSKNFTYYDKTEGSLSYTDTGLIKGKKYYYEVKACYKPYSESVRSSFSSYKYAVPAWPPIKLTAASETYNSIELVWNDIAGAAGYKVLRCDTSYKGLYNEIADVTDISQTSYTDKGLTTGKTYYYEILPYDGTEAGTLSNYKSVKPVPSAPANLQLSKAFDISIGVTWDAVEGATEYEVYRATSKSGTYTRVTTTSDTGCTSAELIVGRTYYFKVRAYVLMGAIKVYGGYSSIAYLKI